MFTGIVEELGVVVGLQPQGEVVRLRLQAERVLREVRVGESVCVNGVCLTVTEQAGKQAAFEVMPETLARTNLGLLRAGDRVNLERALRLDGRLGGHLVQGHVDGVGTIQERIPRGSTVFWRIAAPPEVLRYVVPKGSIAVDGISLTVIERQPQGFTLATIPHTLAQTTLGFRKVGERVNLEADILGKYVEALLGPREDSASQLTWAFLAEQGFA
jgi:riboflavin synthase